MLPSLSFAQPQWLSWVAAAAVVFLLITILAYLRKPLSLGRKILAITLRSIAIIIVLLALLEPMIVREIPKSQANYLGIVVDDTRSMRALIGRNEDASEVDGLSRRWQERLDSTSNWQQALEETYRVKRYRIGDRIESIDNLSEIKLQDNRSGILNSLKLLDERFRGLPVAGVLLVTDGQESSITSGMNEPSPILNGLDALNFPVFPVSPGKMTTFADLRVSEVTHRQSDFEAAPVSVTARIDAEQLEGENATIELRDSQDRVLESKSISFAKTSESQAVTFQFRPDESGVQSFSIKAFVNQRQVLDIVPGVTSPVASASERTLANNKRTFVIDRGRGPYRLLYLAGRPNWEHKFLRRALDEDAELQLVSLVRIAKKEPKFSFRDSRIDSANPLFSGFEDVSEEEKEQYNEPVFVRLGVTDAEQLQKGFPNTADELFQYHAVIVDDLEHEFFSADQQSLLRQYVSARGGSLLYLGGVESLRGKGFRESLLAQMLPIYGESRPVGSEANPESADKSSRFRLTREGWLEPFLRTSDNESKEKERLAAMPSFRVINDAGGIKPGAVVLADIFEDDGGSAPALVSQRFGKGKSAVLLIGDMWRAGLSDSDSSSATLAQSWRQMIRWLIKDVPKPISLAIERANPSSPGLSTTVLVDAKSIDFEPLENVVVDISVRKPDGTMVTGRAEPSSNQQGVYEFAMLTDAEGSYAATASVTDKDGSEIGSGQVGWVHEPSQEEMATLGTNEPFLEEIAARTGGKVLASEEFEKVDRWLSSLKMPVSEKELQPIWHRGWLMGIVVACLAGEWWIRRRNGLR